MNNEIKAILNNKIDELTLEVMLVKLKLKYDIERMIMVKTGETK